MAAWRCCWPWREFDLIKWLTCWATSLIASSFASYTQISHFSTGLELIQKLFSTYKSGLLWVQVDVVIALLHELALDLGVRALVGGSVTFLSDKTHLGLENSGIGPFWVNEADTLPSDMSLDNLLCLRVVKSLTHVVWVMFSPCHVTNQPV